MSHPFDEQLAELVRAMQIRTIPPLEAEVLSQGADGSLELRLLLTDDLKPLWGLDAGLQGVPLALQGCWAVKLAPGARVVLEFLDGDPRKRIVRTILSGTFTEVTLGATSIKIGDAASTITLAGSAQTLVRVGDVLATGLSTAAGGGPVTGTIAIAPPLSKVKG